jgi:hypothetical protein
MIDNLFGVLNKNSLALPVFTSFFNTLLLLKDGWKHGSAAMTSFLDSGKNSLVASKTLRTKTDAGRVTFCETRPKRSVEVYKGRNLDPPPGPPQT